MDTDDYYDVIRDNSPGTSPTKKDVKTQHIGLYIRVIIPEINMQVNRSTFVSI